ncbi:TonB-dependent receptor [Dysgonomonas sp. 520]|uniref:TonB-dependent receptor n=1 Tax=Dysgonomonas sp. 520 TaxID=2302931 RepID=UPI0013D5C6F1|nr:TonB-dependent receptor [Dysgonomonas sp. 520]NDW09723.1 TonB-dependent receptor [Dysgonomonas sp. 520]
MPKRFYTIIFFSLLCLSNAIAQVVTISGTITDFDGKPMDGVVVGVQNSSNSTFSNSKGQYGLRITPSDSIRLVFNYMGYLPYETVLNGVKADRKLDVMMRERSSDTQLGEVVVKGIRSQTDMVDKIDVSTLKAITSPSGGVESIIATGAGVSTTNEMSSQYSVRGGSYDENIVYVNGIEIYRPLLIRAGQQEGLSFLNPDMVGSIGFSTGGYDAHYGDKMSSVLDITYRKPVGFEASATASMMGASAYVGTGIKRFTQITGIRYKTTKMLLGTQDTDAEYEPSFLDLQTYMTYALSGNWEVSFLGNYSRNQYKFTPKTRETTYGTLENTKNFKVWFDGWEDDIFLTYFGAASIKGKISDKLEVGLTASAFSSDERERYDINGEYQLTDDNLNAGGGQGETGTLVGVGTYFEHARNNLKVNVMNIGHTGSLDLTNHKVKWGFTFQKEDIDDLIKEFELRDSAGYSLPYDGKIVNVFSGLMSDNKTSTTRTSGYLMDTYRFNALNGRVTLTAGVRGSYWSFNKEFIFSPRASIAYVPLEDSRYTLRFATGVYYQAPFYKEFQKVVEDEDGNSVIELNKDIKSQKSVHFVLGGDYNFKAAERPFKFTTELYYKKLSDLIPYTVDNVKIRYAGRNMASGYAMGVDMKLFGEFVKGTDNWVSLSFMKTNQKINGTNVPLPTDQLYNLSLFFQDYFMGHDRLKANIQGHLSQGLPTRAPQKSYDSGFFRTPAYRRLDIGFSWQLLGENFDVRHRSAFAGAFKNVWIGLDVFNLFDIKNTNSYYWVTDIFNQQYSVPNYLTGRQLNFRIIADF